MVKNTNTNNTDVDYVAVEYINTTVAEKTADNTWEVVSTVKERQKLPNGEWVEEQSSAMCIDYDLRNAIEVATKSVLSFIIQEVYKNGYNGLIDYFANKRNEEDKKKNGS